jgi:hypothetical protein
MAHAERAATSKPAVPNESTKRMGEFFRDVVDLNAVFVECQIIRITVAMAKVTKCRAEWKDNHG